jgi:hypothetical protein
MSSKEGLKGLPAAMIANEVIGSEEGKKAIGQSVNAAKLILVALGSLAVVRYGHSKFKKLRADRFARENVGNPNLTAAAIIYESFTRVGFPDSSLLSFLIPSINISTDESALYGIASQVTNVKAVSEAYSILFDRNLFDDIRKGLDTDELKTFWNIINSPSDNQNIQTLYPIGTNLYSASKNMITVNKAVKDENGNWKGTGELYGNFEFREEVGEVIAHGVFTKSDATKENYYIIERGWFFKDQGVVLQHQITNKKI